MSKARGSSVASRLVGAIAVSVLVLPCVSPPAALAEDAGADGGTGVSALGRIEPQDGVLHIGSPSMVNAVSGAIVRKLFVKAGDDVKAGQILAETDTAEVERGEVAVRKAELELAVHKAEMAVGEEQDVCSRADVAQRTAARRTNLRRDGVASDEEADVASGDARALAGACSAARIATKAAESAVEVARAHVQKAEAELERCFVRAPVDGRILRIVRHPGELIAADGVLTMGRVDRMLAIAEIYETDVRRVHRGQKATVTSPAFDGELSGVVQVVRREVRKQDATGTDPAARKDARIVEVEILLDQPAVVADLTNLQVEVLLQP